MLVYIHGNCQAPVLAALLREAHPTWDVRSRPIYIRPTETELDWYKESILSADWVVTQWVGQGYFGIDELSFDWISQSRADRGNVIGTPPVFFQGQMPHAFYLAKNRLDAFPVPIPTPYHNVLVPHMVLQGQSDGDIAERLTSVDLYTPGFVEDRAKQHLIELQRREAFLRDRNTLGPLLQISDLVGGLYRNALVGWTFDHPTRRLMVQIAHRTLDMIGAPANIASAGPDPLNVTRCGILPSVAACLGLPPDQADPSFLHGGHKLDIAEYVRRVAIGYRSGGTEHLSSTLHERPEVTKFLQLYEASRLEVSSDQMVGKGKKIMEPGTV